MKTERAARNLYPTYCRLICSLSPAAGKTLFGSIAEMTVINRKNSISPRASFTDQLRQKSRLRRDRQERLAQASIARPRRNDVLPRLELSYIPIDHLRPSPKRVRKLDPA